MRKNKGAIIGSLVSQSLEKYQEAVEVLTPVMGEVIDTIKSEVFPRISFPSLDLFLRAYEFSQRCDLDKELKGQYVSEDKKSSRRRRRYHRLYRVYCLLRDFVFLKTGDPRVVIPFSSRLYPGTLYLDQEARVWLNYGDEKKPRIAQYVSLVTNDSGILYLYDSFCLTFPRELIGSLDRAVQCSSNPAQIRRDLDALEKYYDE